MLRGENLSKNFGGVRALSDFHFVVGEKEIVGLVGPNGAGKTTVFNLISGVYTPTKGDIWFEGKKITGLPPHKILRLGIARTFQIPRPFKNFTVLDNVATATLFGRANVLSHSAARQYALEVCRFIGLIEKKDVPARQLTAQELRMLELARALATKPQVILLDEIAAGLTTAELENVVNILRKLREEKGLAFFIVEHVMKMVMMICDRVIFMAEGKKICEGKPKEIICDPVVIEAYLGKSFTGK